MFSFVQSHVDWWDACSKDGKIAAKITPLDPGELRHPHLQLEGVHRAQPEDLRDLVERCLALPDEDRVCKVLGLGSVYAFQL